MGFRDRWLNNAGMVSDHYEVFLHAVEREVPDSPVDMLLVGVKNGGDVEIWPDVLAEGSTITAIDQDEACASLGVDVLVGDPSDQDWLLSVLANKGFDVVIWNHPGISDRIWPWLRPGGKLIIEGLWQPSVSTLASAVAGDTPSWLPTEEVMRVTVFPHVTVVEKRTPRVLPYIRIMTGNFAEVVSEQALISEGVKRVLVD